MDDPASISRIDNPLWDSLERALAKPFPTARPTPQMDRRVHRRAHLPQPGCRRLRRRAVQPRRRPGRLRPAVPRQRRTRSTSSHCGSPRSCGSTWCTTCWAEHADRQVSSTQAAASVGSRVLQRHARQQHLTRRKLDRLGAEVDDAREPVAAGERDHIVAHVEPCELVAVQLGQSGGASGARRGTATASRLRSAFLRLDRQLRPVARLRQPRRLRRRSRTTGRNESTATARGNRRGRGGCGPIAPTPGRRASTRECRRPAADRALHLDRGRQRRAAPVRAGSRPAPGVCPSAMSTGSSGQAVQRVRRRAASVASDVAVDVVVAQHPRDRRADHLMRGERAGDRPCAVRRRPSDNAWCGSRTRCAGVSARRYSASLSTDDTHASATNTRGGSYESPTSRHAR